MSRPPTSTPEAILGRLLLAALFAAGAVQKALDPEPAMALLTGLGLSAWLIWPALVANALGAALLVSGIALRPAARALAAYCILTSIFHFVPSDGWQMSIFVKNWAIAGGLLVLSAAAGERSRRPDPL